MLFSPAALQVIKKGGLFRPPRNACRRMSSSGRAVDAELRLLTALPFSCQAFSADRPDGRQKPSIHRKKAHCIHSALYFLAERKGLEPSASGVTGRRYNRLNYRSGWWAVQDLNLWPPPCEGGALPAELTALVARLVLRKLPPFVKQKILKRGIFFEKNYN